MEVLSLLLSIFSGMLYTRGQVRKVFLPKTTKFLHFFVSQTNTCFLYRCMISFRQYNHLGDHNHSDSEFGKALQREEAHFPFRISAILFNRQQCLRHSALSFYLKLREEKKNNVSSQLRFVARSFLHYTTFCATAVCEKKTPLGIASCTISYGAACAATAGV